MKTKEFGRMSSIFEFPISKLGYLELFIKTWEENFFLKFLPEKVHTRTGVERVNGLQPIAIFKKDCIVDAFLEVLTFLTFNMIIFKNYQNFFNLLSLVVIKFR